MIYSNNISKTSKENLQVFEVEDALHLSQTDVFVTSMKMREVSITPEMRSPKNTSFEKRALRAAVHSESFLNAMLTVPDFVQQYPRRTVDHLVMVSASITVNLRNQTAKCANSAVTATEAMNNQAQFINALRRLLQFFSESDLISREVIIETFSSGLPPTL